MKSFNLTEWALTHRAIVLFLILAIAIGGVLGFTKLGQLEDPNFSVPSMTVIVIWPGATAQQIQDEVLNRMEKKFEQLDHFEKVKTYARQGYGGMTLSVVGGTSHADQREAWYQARKKFSDIKLELPEGVIGPIFNDEYGDVTGLLYAVKGDGISHAELSDTAEDIKRRLLKVPMVKKVDIYGKQAKKVYVEFSHQRLAALGITPIMIAESLRNQNAVHATGQIDTRGDRVLVRVSGQFNNLDDIRNVPIAAGGRLIKLGDFTSITRGYEDPPTYTVRHNGQQVLMLGIVMTDDGSYGRKGLVTDRLRELILHIVTLRLLARENPEHLHLTHVFLDLVARAERLEAIAANRSAATGAHADRADAIVIHGGFWRAKYGLTYAGHMAAALTALVLGITGLVGEIGNELNQRYLTPRDSMRKTWNNWLRLRRKKLPDITSRDGE